MVPNHFDGDGAALGILLSLHPFPHPDTNHPVSAEVKLLKINDFTLILFFPSIFSPMVKNRPLFCNIHSEIPQ